MSPLRRHLAIALAAAGLALALLGSAGPALAATGNIQTSTNPSQDILLEEPIPQSALEKGVSGAASNSVKGVADYIARIYTFAIGTVGVVAAVMMIIGGFQYLTSAGDAGKIGAAKKRITDAIIGLVLALGSYALLRSLNPQLVSFQPLTVGDNQVKTQVHLLPWCEDLIAKSTAVTRLTAGTKCGDAGSYMNGASELPCIYHGECGATLNPRNERHGGAYFDEVWNTCLQTAGSFHDEPGEDGHYVEMTPDLVLKIAKVQSKEEGYFGICTSCAEINASFANAVGYKSLGDACRTWDATINQQFKTKFGDGSQFWSYCAEAGNNIDGEDDPKSCLQFDVDCQQADNNEDVGSGQCNDNENSCGCEGYDDSPTVRYAIKVDPTAGNVTRIGTHANTPDETSALHLGEFCHRNPCAQYTNTVNHKQNYVKGCYFKGDLTRHITTDFRIDCRNN